MKKKVIVFSLGGSLIVPDNVDTKYLREFKKVILKNTKKYKFIIVCGGGSTARKYIDALKKFNINPRFQSLSGISATRINARFMTYLFNIDPIKGIPHKIRTIKKYLRRQDIVFCGALEYSPHQTSDGTAAGIAEHYNTEFINITNIPGLYDKNPKQYKNARFIPKISWKEFNKMASRIKFKPGQHFVLDQSASKLILHHKIPTYIMGKNLKQLDNLLNNKKFKGTIIQG